MASNCQEHPISCTSTSENNSLATLASHCQQCPSDKLVKYNLLNYNFQATGLKHKWKYSLQKESDFILPIEWSGGICSKQGWEINKNKTLKGIHNLCYINNQAVVNFFKNPCYIHKPFSSFPALLACTGYARTHKKALARMIGVTVYNSL
jgi:hypothetical protein